MGGKLNSTNQQQSSRNGNRRWNWGLTNPTVKQLREYHQQMDYAEGSGIYG